MPVDDQTTARPLTAAELIKKKTRQSKKRKRQKEETKLDLDDEIKRLEAELRSMSADEQDSTGESSDDGASAIVALSTVKNDRIEALPASALPDIPPAKKKQIKGDDSTQRSKTDEKARIKAPLVSQGLKDAVREVLRGYKPRSAEHLPFYCRCCAKQYDNLEQFQAHKTTDFHKAAVELERKASFCRSCRKQLTSPAQLQEHLQSKPHKERLQKLKAKQRQSKKF